MHEIETLRHLDKTYMLFRVLTKQARVECQSHKLTVEDPVTLEYITRYEYMSVKIYNIYIGY